GFYSSFQTGPQQKFREILMKGICHCSYSGRVATLGHMPGVHAKLAKCHNAVPLGAALRLIWFEQIFGKIDGRPFPASFILWHLFDQIETDKGSKTIP